MSNENPTTQSRSAGSESFVELSEGFLVGGGRYSLSQSLGTGGMGTVWLAKDERLGQMVALKFVQFQSNPMVLDDLRRETARSLRLTHPNIIRIYDFYEAPGEVAFISMEYVDGANLHTLRAQQPNNVFTWNFLKPLIKQICDALQYAHSENVIHRDLKPSNMMVDAKGRLKLADFGIASAVSDPLQRYYQRHAASGTITHMSPQQMAGKPATIADDIYALGATLYDLLTGTTPFEGEDIPTQVQNNLAEPISIRLGKLKLVNEIPPHVSAMIMACLSKDPEPRPESARAVAEWIGFHASPVTRPAPISVATVADKPTLEHKTKSIHLPTAPPPVQVIIPEKKPEPILEIPPPEKIPTKKILTWVGASLAALIVFGTLGWLIGMVGKKIFNGNSGPTITSIPDGSAAIDPTFSKKTFVDGFIRCVAVQSDGKMIIGGGFENVNSMESKRIARLNTDGTLDKNFVAAANEALYCVALQEDGKIILGGDFNNISGVDCKSIARLGPDGAVDTSFNLWKDTDGTLRSIAVQPDGKIIIAGHFTKFHGVKKGRIARLNSDGTLDESFKAAANNLIWTAVLQKDKKILIGGDFNMVNATRRNHLARLDSNGELDKNFNTGSGANGWVYAIAVQSDGRIVLGGDFTEFNGRPRNRVARLEADGSLDATFTPGAGPDSKILAVTIQPDQKILIGGIFRFFNDTALGRIARLNVNGSVDQSFDSGIGFDDVVRSVEFQSDGKMLVAGSFTNFNGTACGRIVRLQGSAAKAKK